MPGPPVLRRCIRTPRQTAQKARFSCAVRRYCKGLEAAPCERFPHAASEPPACRFGLGRFSIACEPGGLPSRSRFRKKSALSPESDSASFPALENRAATKLSDSYDKLPHSPTFRGHFARSAGRLSKTNAFGRKRNRLGTRIARGVPRGAAWRAPPRRRAVVDGHRTLADL